MTSDRLIRQYSGPASAEMVNRSLLAEELSIADDLMGLMINDPGCKEIYGMQADRVNAFGPNFRAIRLVFEDNGESLELDGLGALEVIQIPEDFVIKIARHYNVKNEEWQNSWRKETYYLQKTTLYDNEGPFTLKDFIDRAQKELGPTSGSHLVITAMHKQMYFDSKDGQVDIDKSLLRIK